MVERVFVEDLADRAADGTIRFEGREAHHLGTVRRVRAGARVLLLDGVGGARWAAVEAVGRRAIELRLLSVLPPASAPAVSVSLVVSLPKGKRMRWLVEKATELEVASIQPLCAERSVVDGEKGFEHKREAWRQVAIEAAKQSGALTLSTFHAPCSIQEVCAAKAGARVILDPGATDRLGAVLRARAAAAAEACVWLVVGPEGGLTAAEVDRLLAAGAISARLGETILRVETAAIASLAAVRAVLG